MTSTGICPNQQPYPDSRILIYQKKFTGLDGDPDLDFYWLDPIAAVKISC